MKLRGIALAMTLAVGLAGCKTTNQTVGSVIGGIGGAAATYGLTKALGGDGTTAAIVAVAGGLAGAYIGGEIGRYLDEEDSKKAQAASKKAVTTGTTGQTVAWKSDKNPEVYGQTKVVDTGRVSSSGGQKSVTWQRSQRKDPIKPVAKPAPAAPAKAPSAAPANDGESAATAKANTRPAQTRSPAPAAPAPVATAAADPQTAPADDRLCKKIDQVAYINGKETRQQRVFCQTASGGWAPVTV